MKLERLLVSVTEAADLMGVSPSTAYRLARENRIPVIRIGASVKVNLRQLRRTLPLKTKPESYYRDLLAAQYGGRTEVGVRFGRADVVMDIPPEGRGLTVFDGARCIIVEVEPFTRWQHGVRQVLAYAAQMPRSVPALAVYGKLTPRALNPILNRTGGLCVVFALRGDEWELILSPVDRDYFPEVGE